MLKRHSGFAHIAVLMLIALIVLLALGGWWVSRHDKNNQVPVGCGQIDAPANVSYPNGTCLRPPATPATNTFKDCVGMAGSKMIETYPEICVSPDGKSFPNPSQQMCNGQDMACQNNMTPPSGY